MEVATTGNDPSSSIPTQTQTNIQIPHQEENEIPIRKKHNVFTKLFMVFCIKLFTVFCIKLFMLFCLILLGVIVTVIALLLMVLVLLLPLAIMVIVPAVALPLLLMSLIVVRLLQIVRQGDEYERLSLLKILIRAWIVSVVILLLVALGIFYAISTRVTSLKHVILIGLPLSRWVSSIVCMICGVCCLSYACVAGLYLMFDHLIGRQRSGVVEAFIEIVDCLLFLFAETRVMKLVLEFKNHKILGLYTKSWLEVTVFVIIGYNVIRLLAYMILSIVKRLISKLNPVVNTKSVLSLLIEKILFPNYLLFCANRLRSDITFILTSIMILLTWVLYFASHLTETNQAKGVSKFGSRTCISLLIFSLLWLIKRVTLLIWETNAIYGRLSSQILEAGKHLYFLGMLSPQNYDIFNIKYETNSSRAVDGDDEQSARNELLASKGRTKDSQKGLSNLYRSLTRTSRNIEETDMLKSYDEREEERTNQPPAKKLSTKQRKSIKQELLLENQTPTLYDIEQVGKYLLATKNSLSKKMNIQHILDTLKTICSSDGKRSPDDGLKELIDSKNNTYAAQGSNETSTREERNKPQIDKSDLEEILYSRDDNRSPDDGLKELIGGKNNTYAAQGSNETSTREERNKPQIDKSDLEEILYSRDDNRSPDDGLKELIDGKNNTYAAQELNETSTREERNKLQIDKSDLEVLLNHLDVTDQISFEELGRRMEKKRDKCVLLANTIKSAKELANCLNQITSLILVVAAFIMWLLLTGLATTKVLVLIASPLLAATFVFGDTCKSMFQGIIFVFVVNPFHVGDLCVINDKLMEVKAIGIWTTTFSSVEKVGTLEEVIYPNSKLAAEVIINHKTVFDCNDNVEFILASFDDQKIKTLKSEIKDYFKDKDGKSPGTCHTIAVLTTESNIKITVTFEHKMDISRNTFFECVKEKNELRSAFVVHVQNLIKNDVAPDPPPNTISAGDEAEFRGQNVEKRQI